MDTKRIVPWAFALIFAVLASSEVLHAGAGQAGQAQAGRLAANPLAPPPPPKWQYKFWAIDYSSRSGYQYIKENDLNALGLQGWELVTVLPNSSEIDPVQLGNAVKPTTFHTSVLIFKKPL